MEGREPQIAQRQNAPSDYTLGNPRVNHACAPRYIKRGKIFPKMWEHLGHTRGASGIPTGFDIKLPPLGCEFPKSVLPRVRKIVNVGLMWTVEAVIHLPARLVSQMHKFPKRRTNVVPDVSIWTQKIMIMAYSRMQRYRSL